MELLLVVLAFLRGTTAQNAATACDIAEPDIIRLKESYRESHGARYTIVNKLDRGSRGKWAGDRRCCIGCLRIGLAD